MKLYGISQLLVCLLCLSASAASTDVVVDQQYVAPSTIGYALDYPGDYMAQTFTVHNSGQLVGIGVQVSISGSPSSRDGITDDLHLKLIRTDSSGVPTIGDVLASHTISRFDVPFWSSSVPILNVDLTGDNLQVHLGDVLAIALSSDYTYYSHSENRNYDWNTSIFDQIPGGLFFVYSPRVFGPTPFYKWNTSDPTVTRDAGSGVSTAICR